MLTPPSHVHWARCSEDTTAVLDLRSGQWTVLDGAGARIWHTFVEGGDLTLLARELSPTSDLSAARDAIGVYIAHLSGLRLLTPPERKPRVTRRRWRR
ncbi:PqqD family protein [Streptomyces tsukubensis]|uniref:PqqD family protein n=1 Tax=Streptomyces tsukubensis TaxID=83656 RepID=UPI00344DF5C4